jgi:hemerythrin-like domain-containing protein
MGIRRYSFSTVSTSDRDHAIGREMAMVHRMFRREFLLAAEAVRHVAVGDTRSARIVAAHLRIVASTLHHHHSGEDSYVWPLLELRAPSHVSEHLLCVMEQHQRIDEAHAEVEGELPMWSCRAAAGSRGRLANALDRLVDPLIEHMDYEERHVVPVMEAHISVAEWDQIVQKLTAGLDPSQSLLVMGMIFYEGGQDTIEQTIANMPAELRVGAQDTAAHAYAEHAALVHGSPTPPRSTEIRQ